MSQRTLKGRLRRGAPSVLVAAALVGTLLLGAPAATAAPVQPTPPTAQDVQAAKGAVAAAARSVADMEVRLAQLSAQTDAATLKVQQAGEAYTQALADVDTAQQNSRAAATASADAATGAETARRQLVAIVREVARSGGSTDLLQAVLSADGFQDVASRSSALDRISGKTDQAVQQYKASLLVATTLASRAEAAATKATAAKASAADALSAAQQAQDDAEKAQSDAAVERDSLLDDLAAARQTSVDIERARQDALDQQRRDREDAAAKAAALRPAPVAVAVVTRPVTTAPVVTAPPAVVTPPSGSTTPPPVVAPPVVTAPPATTTPYGLGTGTSRGSAGSGAAALAWAETKIGLPYVWGAAGPSSYDCSGLTMSAWRAAGVNLNRTSRDQYKQVLKVRYDDLRPGDLVFWSTNPNDANAIYHVAMWAGNGMIMEAPQPLAPLRLVKMRWSSTMPYAGRP